MDTKKYKAGVLRKQYDFKSFSPEPINHEWIISDPKLAALQSEADRKLGALNAAGRWVENIDYFISMHIAKEAMTSSRIEGTQTTIEEALAEQEDINPERRDDWAEVQNYIAAMNSATKKLRTLPMSGRLFKETHRILLAGARGKEKNPGEYRKSQNWLGSSLKFAAYVPPAANEVADLMSDLEKFLNNENIDAAPLTRIGIAHYQFETIHPFLDGNGRLGRLLITLYLVAAGILDRPTLYLSDYFERNRAEYYDRLTLARQKNDLEGWLRFFFVGVIETSESAVRTLANVVELRHEIEAKKLPKLGARLENGIALLKLLYSRPIVDRASVEESLGLSASTADRLLAEFQKLGILQETTGNARNRRYAFREYLNIFSGNP